MGQAYTEFPSGISSVRLGPGDCLIQAPGTIHAVVTPTDSMIAGVFFYTAPYFHRSIECVRLAFEKGLYDNEDIQSYDFDNLTTIVRYQDAEGLFTPAELEAN